MDILSKNTQFFTELEAVLQKFGHGSIDFTIIAHQGKVVGVEGHQFQKLKFGKKGNVAATAKILELIKEAYEKKKDGTLNFSVKMKKGNIEEVVFQKHLVLKY